MWTTIKDDSCNRNEENNNRNRNVKTACNTKNNKQSDT